MCYLLLFTYLWGETMQENAKSSVFLLLEEINRKNENVVALSDVIFGTPIRTTEHNRNTKLHVGSQPGGNYSDDQWIWYNRLDIAEVFQHLDKIHVEVSVEGTPGYLDVLHAVNLRYNLDIQDDEIVPTDVVANRMMLRLSDTSLAFTGAVNIILAVDGDIPLYNVLLNTTLDGLWYPDAIIHHLTYPEYFKDGTLLSDGAKANGTLQYNTGHPATHMVIATNNELEVAVRAGVIGMPPTVPVDGELNLVVSSTQHVEFVFSIVLLNTLISSKLEELYDISFYLNCKDTPATFIATLVKGVNGTYHFISDDRTQEVNGVQQFASGKVLQTVQSIENFPTILDGGIAGTYEIGLVAYRRNSIVPRLEAVANFTVTVQD
jgi:hypothetical protein